MPLLIWHSFLGRQAEKQTYPWATLNSSQTHSSQGACKCWRALASGFFLQVSLAPPHHSYPGLHTGSSRLSFASSGETPSFVPSYNCWGGCLGKLPRTELHRETVHQVPSSSSKAGTPCSQSVSFIQFCYELGSSLICWRPNSSNIKR